jgi:AmiR/NasT family two-component response regulator
MSSPALPRHRSRPSTLRAPLAAHATIEVPAPAAADLDRVQALEIEVTQLRTAMASRAVIEQAKGVLMLLTGCADQVAFDLLTHISSHTHRKVREIAQELVNSATGRCPLPPDVKVILRDACPPSHPLS